MYVCFHLCLSMKLDLVSKHISHSHFANAYIHYKSTGQFNSSFTRLNLSTTIHPFLDLPDLAVVLLLDIGLEDFHPVVELDLVEMQVQVLDRHISRCCKIVILCKKKWPEAETPNNFLTSRFSQVCPDFSFLQNANLYNV